MPKHTKSGHTRSDSTSDLSARVKKALGLLKEVHGLIPELRSLTPDQRIHSQGKMRDGESEILRSILDVVDAKPTLFDGLADEDDGHDPEKLETSLLRDRLDTIDALAPLAAKAEALAQSVADAILETGSLVRPVTLAAYQIAKPLAGRDKAIGDKLSDAIAFYRGPAAAAQRTRKKKKAPK